MADETVQINEPIASHLNLFRALNPSHLVGGLPTEQHFIMKKNRPNDGVSTGLESLITLQQLRGLEALIHYGKRFAVAVLNVGEVLQPVRETGIRVISRDAPEWGAHSQAHAEITGYASLSNKQVADFGRHLAKLARRQYYPVGSEELATSE